MADRACAREPEPRAAGHALELGGCQRQVGGQDDDAAPSGRRGLIPLGKEAADGDACEAKLARGAEVREDERAKRAAGNDPARRPDPSLPAETAHAGPGTD